MKITKLEPQMKDGKPNGFKVEISDGAWGYLVVKDSDKDLALGEEVTYTAVTPEGKSYKKMTIKRAAPAFVPTGGVTPQFPSSTPQKPVIHVGAGKSLEELKCEALLQLTKLVYEKQVIPDKMDLGEMALKVKDVAKFVYSEYDDIFAKK